MTRFHAWEGGFAFLLFVDKFVRFCIIITKTIPIIVINKILKSLFTLVKIPKIDFGKGKIVAFTNFVDEMIKNV